MTDGRMDGWMDSLLIEVVGVVTVYIIVDSCILNWLEVLVGGCIEDLILLEVGVFFCVNVWCVC